MLLGDEGEGETTLVDESTIVDDPNYNQQPLPEGTAMGERSAPPTRQKDGQPLEPLHEVCSILNGHNKFYYNAEMLEFAFKLLFATAAFAKPGSYQCL